MLEAHPRTRISTNALTTSSPLACPGQESTSFKPAPATPKATPTGPPTGPPPHPLRYPEGAAVNNELGNLPIHYACEKVCTQVVMKLLLGAYPNATHDRDERGSESAQRGDRLQMFEFSWLVALWSRGQTARSIGVAILSPSLTGTLAR